MPAKLSTHVLDLMHGRPAAGMKIELWELDGAERELIRQTITNVDGRTDEPLLAASAMTVGQYEIIFHVGEYFEAHSEETAKARFLDQVPVRFRVTDNGASYHVPLLCTPWAYSTYRGS
jgi:5-hydroxyisourate hydrolase